MLFSFLAVELCVLEIRSGSFRTLFGCYGAVTAELWYVEMENLYIGK